MPNYEKELIEIINCDNHIISILKVVEQLNIQDAWVCAGCIRNKVWDHLHNTITPVNDIDVIYFDITDTSLEKEKQLEARLESLLPNQPWSVKNQARMYLKSGFDPFTSSFDGVAHFPEIPTAVAVRWRNKEVEIMAPYGLQHLFEMKVEPTPFYQRNSEFYSIYLERVKAKKVGRDMGKVINRNLERRARKYSANFDKNRGVTGTTPRVQCFRGVVL